MRRKIAQCVLVYRGEERLKVDGIQVLDAAGFPARLVPGELASAFA